MSPETLFIWGYYVPATMLLLAIFSLVFVRFTGGERMEFDELVLYLVVALIPGINLGVSVVLCIGSFSLLLISLREKLGSKF